MVNPEYCKGSFCVHASVFCQEGHCSGCEIYKIMTSGITQANRCEGVKLQKIHQPVLVR